HRVHAGVEHGHLLQPLDLGALLARRDPGDHVGAVLERLPGVKRAGRAGHALDHEPGIFSNQYAHFASSTAFLAPSAMSAAATRLRPLCSRIFLPRSTLVPSRRTTRGTLSPTSLTAAITPLAMVSHFMIPPKMLMKMLFTLGSRVMILKAAVTFS